MSVRSRSTLSSDLTSRAQMDHHSAPGLPKFAGAFLDDFRRRANVVREIQSGLAQTKRRWDIAHTILVVVLGAAITFLGFMGPDRILDAWPNVAVVPGALPNK